MQRLYAAIYMLNPSQRTIKTYNKIAKEYAARGYNNPLFWHREFKIFQKLISGKRVIDIGCGSGKDALLFIKNKFDYIGIDASSGLLHEARKFVKSGKFILMNFYKLKFPQNHFDGFWAAASLLHIPKRRVAKVLRAIRKIIKSQGIGFIALKEKRHLDEGIIKEKKHGGIERYFAFYTKVEFQKILEQNGFKILRNHIHQEEDTNWLCYFVRKI
ncbi:MAG: class I SAM-dependent methyltransferase [Patescibacteria group bacterium]|nr:class I SAM-dependent methyltransferase [Patescibacteria group bacterium]